MLKGARALLAIAVCSFEEKSFQQIRQIKCLKALYERQLQKYSKLRHNFTAILETYAANGNSALPKTKALFRVVRIKLCELAVRGISAVTLVIITGSRSRFCGSTSV